MIPARFLCSSPDADRAAHRHGGDWTQIGTNARGGGCFLLSPLPPHNFATHCGPTTQQAEENHSSLSSAQHNQ